MAPGTEFACDFCAGIGPLQLGVVLVYIFSSTSIHSMKKQSFAFWRIERGLNSTTALQRMPMPIKQILAQLNQLRIIRNHGHTPLSRENVCI